jgi:hypothetical protein
VVRYSLPRKEKKRSGPEQNEKINKTKSLNIVNKYFQVIVVIIDGI